VNRQVAARVDAILRACEEVLTTAQAGESGWEARHDRARARLRRTLADRDSYLATTQVVDDDLRGFLAEFMRQVHHYAAYDAAQLDRRGVLHPLPEGERPVRQRDRAALLIDLHGRVIAAAVPVKKRVAELVER
jgi:hypothetical protein